jgi:2-polyprenyl-6-hydroxyphenyl methylase/3-demethylubiquinone-9 3-methyltransferase
MIAALRPPSPEPRPCKICSASAPLYGVVDFSRSCEMARGIHLPLVGVPVYYRRCIACGFLFSDTFDDWTEADFQRHIYNDDYITVDPDYAETRPSATAALVTQLFGANKTSLRVLDYGGGNGKLGELLRADGFSVVETYDPFTPEHAQLPETVFDLVTSFETFEHLPDPNSGIADIVERLANPGLVLFTTLVQPEDFDRLRMAWWYIAPRNGHISIFTRRALALAWQRHGFSFGSIDDNRHVAFRQLPDFAKHLIRPQSSPNP